MKTKYGKRSGLGRRRMALGGWRFDDVRAQGYAKTTISASAAGVIEAPVIRDNPLEVANAGWIVTVYDNDHNTYEEVMAVLMIATACNAEEAFLEAWEVDHLGKSVVHNACEKECRKVADVIGRIGIKVEVSEE